MNDFTKEELGEIFWILEGCTMDYIGKEGDILINKIQFLIDNYCEHESNGYWSQLADCSYRSLRCSKCRREFGRQKFNSVSQKFEDEFL